MRIAALPLLLLLLPALLTNAAINYRSPVMKIATLLVLLLAAPLALHAQAPTGSISGCVLDDKGQPLNRATIQIEGTSRGGYTRPDGTYLITNIPLGTWNIRVLFPGKHNVMVAEVQVNRESTACLDTVRMVDRPSRGCPVIIDRTRSLVRENGGTIRVITGEEMLRLGIGY